MSLPQHPLYNCSCRSSELPLKYLVEYHNDGIVCFMGGRWAGNARMGGKGGEVTTATLAGLKRWRVYSTGVNITRRPWLLLIYQYMIGGSGGRGMNAEDWEGGVLF